jgi:vacuolar-type H+-ATPase subunit I/STV1
MTVREKLIKICDSFQGKNFELPRGGDTNEISNKIRELTRRIDDSTSLIATTQVSLRKFLIDV